MADLVLASESIFSSMLIKSREIEGEDTLVCLKELHERLRSKRRLYDWAKDRLSNFTEGIDYTQHKIVSRDNSTLASVDYYVTIDTAKHLAMLEKSFVGRSIRQYFIEVEKAWRKEHLLKEERLAALEAKEARREAARENPMYTTVKKVTKEIDGEDLEVWLSCSEPDRPDKQGAILAHAVSSLSGWNTAIRRLQEIYSTSDDLPEEIYMKSGDVLLLREAVIGIATW